MPAEGGRAEWSARLSVPLLVSVPTAALFELVLADLLPPLLDQTTHALDLLYGQGAARADPGMVAQLSSSSLIC
jgi:hypothetical protein